MIAAKLELPSLKQCCYSWIFFLNAATLVMVTVGSVRSKTGHHSSAHKDIATLAIFDHCSS